MKYVQPHMVTFSKHVRPGRKARKISSIEEVKAFAAEKGETLTDEEAACAAAMLEAQHPELPSQSPADFPETDPETPVAKQIVEKPAG